MHDAVGVAYFGEWVLLVAVILAFVYGMARLWLRHYEVREHWKWSPQTITEMFGGKRNVEDID